MAKIIAFYNKGGVAKKQTATNIAGVLSLEKKTLLIDGDPHGDASLAFGVDLDELETTLGAYLISGWAAKQASDYFIKINDYLDIIPTNQTLSDFIVQAAAETNEVRSKHLLNFVESVKKYYDYIIFDMAPAVDIVDDLVVVASTETYAVKNAETTLKITDDRNVKVRHIVPTKVQMSTDTYIPNLIAFAESVTLYQLLILLTTGMRYKKARSYYKNLAKELNY